MIADAFTWLAWGFLGALALAGFMLGAALALWIGAVLLATARALASVGRASRRQSQ